MCWSSRLTSSGEVENNTTSSSSKSYRKMVSSNQKGFLTVVVAFAMVTLLSCFSPVSSYKIRPHVSRTDDAIIIDYTGVGYAPFSVGRGYGQYANPGSVSAFDPYGMFYSPWSHFGRQASVSVGPAPAPAPAPSPPAASQCGRGPSDFTLTNPPPARQRVGSAISVPAFTNPWPFLVTLRKSVDLPNVYFCSGSLISETKVLLAAQCFEKLSLDQVSDVIVWVGMVGLPGGVAPNLNAPMTRRISKVVIHSAYNALTFANDIAIITLDMPVTFSRIVSPVCLPPANTDVDQYADKNAAIMGWGLAAGKLTPITAAADFKQGKVTIGANIECSADVNIASFFTNNNLCLRAPDAVKLTDVFTCADDVGGPVVINTAAERLEEQPIWTLVGINSFTPAGCTANGLKTRVSAYRSWIALYMA